MEKNSWYNQGYLAYIKYGLYMMVKVYIFNKSNNLSIVCDFKKVFQCIDMEIYLTHCKEMSAVYHKKYFRL